MNKKKWVTISILPIMWIIYFLFELLTGRIDSNSETLMMLLLSIPFALVGYLVYTLWNSYRAGFRNKTLIIFFAFLMILDQGTKFIIHKWFFNENFDILGNLLSFQPIINTDGSWLNVRFGAGIDFGFLILINIIALFIFFECYRYYVYNGHKDFTSDMCIVFIMAGALCSLIDKIFYGGSLDFIGISNLFIADFKDIYINLAILFFLLCIYYNEYWKDEEESSLKDDVLAVKNFFIFAKNDLLKNVFKIKK
ncbi:signal peptidase II [Clostridium sp. B9]|uniref:signal peptidase II n=1 Tax=Clostridium sp. B9 TaxID=3423224 RepID=UPI003D2EF38F